MMKIGVCVVCRKIEEMEAKFQSLLERWNRVLIIVSWFGGIPLRGATRTQLSSMN